MQWVRTVVMGVVVCGIGCTKTNPLDCSNGHCADPARPYCDADGVVGGVDLTPEN